MWDMRAFFQGYWYQQGKNMIFVKLSPEIPQKHTQTPDGFSFQQTHVSSDGWVIILWVIILCSLVRGQQEGTGRFGCSNTGVVYGNAGASVAPLCPSETKMGRKIVCLKRGRVYQ